MLTNYQKITSFYNEVCKFCKPGEYNVLLHKHLGDVVYAIAMNDEFKRQYGEELHYIVRPQHEFLMKMFNVSNYSLLDISKFEKYVNNMEFPYLSSAHNPSHKFDMICKNLFSSIPLKSVPYILDGDLNSFFLFDNYFSFRWLLNTGLNIDNFKFPLPKNRLSVSSQLLNKLESISPIDKIVLIAPEASTALEFPVEFWNIIANKVYSKGYKIVVNSRKYKINHGISVFDLGLSLEEVVELGLNCAYVFSLRSGLCDALVGLKDRLYTFYPAMLHREINSLNMCFVPSPNVNEIEILGWKISNVIWEGEDLTCSLQKYINSLYRLYLKEKIKTFIYFFNSERRKKHKFWKNLWKDLCGYSKIYLENNVMNKNNKNFSNVKIKFSIIPIFSRIFIKKNEDEWSIKRLYLGGVIYHKINNYGEWRLSFCGFQLCSFNKQRKSLLFFNLSNLNWQKKWLSELDDKIDTSCDDVYLLRHNIGETYVELMHIKDRIKSNNSKKPVVIVWRKKYINFYKMFIPAYINLQYIPLRQSEIHKMFEGTSDNYKDVVLTCRNHRFFCSTPKIAENIKKDLVYNPKLNFYSYILNAINLTTSSNIITPYISDELSQRVDDLMQRIGLSDKFVIIAPEATSLIAMDSDFWNDLVQEFIKKGYDIFSNQYFDQYNIKNVKTYNIMLDELFLLSKRSCGIISMASGLSVFLTAANVSMDLIYTGFQNKKLSYTSSLVMQIYSVYSLPYVDKNIVKEYDIMKFDKNEIKNMILARY